MEMTIQLASSEEAMSLFGMGDRNLKLLRERLPIELTARGEVVRLRGEATAVHQAATLMKDMVALLRDGLTVSPDYLEQRLVDLPPVPEPLDLGPDPVGDSLRAEAVAGPPLGGDSLVASVAEATGEASVGEDRLAKALESGQQPRPRRTHGGPIAIDEAAVEGLARSPGQESYVRSILKHDIAFCTGPAGTGKTFLAVRMAVSFLREGQIRKLILCRPAVEAGEKLGFLPGDFQAKINPYLRPLYDALNEILSYDQVKRYIEREIIEIIPLAYMRGRTLNNAFIILDEGQNTTASQMKMFLTRMGASSKIVVNGDTTQVDLPEGQLSGLIQVQRFLRDIKGIGWVEMQGVDIVRHPLVRSIVEAYDRVNRRRSDRG